jgi:DNA end-binding protein Ku
VRLRNPQQLGLPPRDLAVELRVAQQRGSLALLADLGGLALGVELLVAHEAAAAGDVEGDDHPITGRDLSDLGSHRLDDAHGLMAEDVALAHERPHDLVEVKIRAADATRSDPDNRVGGLQKRICSKEGKEVPYEEVAKGYELRGGKYVMLGQEEIDAAAGEHSRQIELETFVRQEHIDPVHYDRCYYLGVGEDGADAYRLLRDALARSSRAGLGRWVFHNREYLVAVRSTEGAMAMQTMRFADELVDVDELELPKASRAPSKREIEMAGRLVDSLHGRFRPSAFKDSYRERVLRLIERKAKGEEIELSPPEESEATSDLAAALEASLNGKSKATGSGSRSRGSRSRGSRSGGKRGRKKAKGSG